MKTFATALLFVFCASSVSTAQVLDWARQLRAGSVDLGLEVASNAAGDVYLVGDTNGAMGVQEAGGTEGFLASFTSDGTFRSVLQNGLGDALLPDLAPVSPEATSDSFRDVAIDSLGRVHIVADYAVLAGPGTFNREVSAYAAITDTGNPGEAAGQLQVTLGSGEVVADERLSAGALSVDANDEVYVGVSVFNPISTPSSLFIAKYDTNGTRIGSNTPISPTALGIPSSFGLEVNDSATNLLQQASQPGTSTSSYFVGGGAGSTVAYVASVDANLNQRWIATLDSTTPLFDQANGVAVAADGSVFVAGGTGGDLHGNTNAGGGSDIFVTKFDADGNRLWTRLYGDSLYDIANDIEIDEFGNLYIGGVTAGTGGQGATGDAFVAKLDSNGEWLWDTTLSTAGAVNGLSIAGGGSLYVAGTVHVSFDEIATPFNPNGVVGSGAPFDAFVAKVTDLQFMEFVPEPSSAALVGAVLGFGLFHRRPCT